MSKRIDAGLGTLSFRTNLQLTNCFATLADYEADLLAWDVHLHHGGALPHAAVHGPLLVWQHST